MASIQGIYLAFFGRPADPLGLAYWEEQTNGGADLSVMLNALSGTEEYQSRFIGMSSAEVIESIYQALFGREPEAEGLAHFLEALAIGTQTLGSIAVNILDGAKGTDLAIIENKIAAADAFTASLDTPEEIAAYSGDAAADFGRAFINQVTEDPATVPTAEEVQEQINSDLPDYEAPSEAPAPGGGGGSAGGGGLTPQQQFIQKWTEMDKAYYANPKDPLYYDKPLNLAKVELANDYVAWLKAGNAAITTIVQTRVNGIENPDARQQSLHDNILGELADAAIADRFKDGDPRSVDAKAFGTRPYSGGYDGDSTNAEYQKGADFYQAAAWDLAFGVKREAISFPEVVTVKGPFTIGGVEYTHIVRGTVGQDTVTYAELGTVNPLNLKPYMDDVEIIHNSNLRNTVDRVPDVDLTGVRGVKEVWTNVGASNGNDNIMANYPNSNDSIVFGIEGGKSAYSIVRVRYPEDDAKANPDDVVHFSLSKNKEGSYTTTGEIDYVEHITFHVKADNAGGQIGFHGKFLKTATITGESDGKVEFITDNVGIQKIDASASHADITLTGYGAFEMAANGTVLGGHGDDVLDLKAQAGGSVIDGGAGNDIITGGTGNDIITGGTGNDTFVFRGTAIGNDIIVDFEKGVDVIDLKGYAKESVNVAHTDDASIITSTEFTGSITVGVTGLTTADFIF